MFVGVYPGLSFSYMIFFQIKILIDESVTLFQSAFFQAPVILTMIWKKEYILMVVVHTRKVLK